MSARSYLYVPGHRDEMLAKAQGRGADAVIADLEDAVPPARKQDARDAVAMWLDEGPSGADIWIRINADTVADDIAAVMRPGVAGVLVAKANADLLGDADAALSIAETRSGLPRGTFQVIALVETAAAMIALPDIAAAPRVVRLALGEADLCAELGLQPSAGQPELLSLRVQTVVASAAAGLAPPVGPVSTDFTDLEALRASTRQLLRLGFRSRSAIHPAQLDVIHEVFTATADEVSRARDLVARFEAAGGAATTDEHGRMIDLAVIRAAQDVLARAASQAGP